MKILVRQFLGKNHSWSVVGWGIANSLINKGHDVDLFSTDGIAHLPLNLKNNLIGYTEENQQKVHGKPPTDKYDCQISYTAMKNFPHYFLPTTKTKLGVWCYEWAGTNVLPTGFAKFYKSCDYLCPPSNFAKQIFLDSKIPESSIKMIPHGIGSSYLNNDTITLPTNKKYKILVNVAQNHLRKNLNGTLEAYGRAFTNKDDVSLILKIKDKTPSHPFEVSIKDVLQKFYKKFPNHAEVKTFTEFVADISVLYRSVDTVFSLPYCEAFYFPGLEAIMSGKLAIAPAWGGQLDFLNSDNALLVTGKETRADPRSMYWEGKSNAIWFEPSIDDAAEKLKFAYANYESLNKKINNQRNTVYQKYCWDNIANQYLELCQ